MAGVLNLCFSIFKRIFSGSALFQRAAAARFRKKKKKNLSQSYVRWIVGFREPSPDLFALKKGATDWRLEMSELTPHKERFLHEVEQKLLRKELDAKLLDDGLIHIRWNEKPLCSVDRDGIVRFRPAASDGHADCHTSQGVYADL